MARTIVLSTLLALLLIVLGIKYHWGDYLRITHSTSHELLIPYKTEFSVLDQVKYISVSENEFVPKIIQSDQSSHLLEAMSKEQVGEQCMRLLSKTILDNFLLELAVANCVVSNYQAMFQKVANTNDNKSQLIKSCNHQINEQAIYSIVEKQLLVGICVSDRLTR